MDGAATFILMHEVGHALVDVLDLPITGREEDAVDQLAAMMLINTGDKGATAALNGVRAIQPGQNAIYDNSDFADEHSLGPQRLFNIACWIYGSTRRSTAPSCPAAACRWPARGAARASTSGFPRPGCGCSSPARPRPRSTRDVRPGRNGFLRPVWACPRLAPGSGCGSVANDTTVCNGVEPRRQHL